MPLSLCHSWIHGREMPANDTETQFYFILLYFIFFYWYIKMYASEFLCWDTKVRLVCWKFALTFLSEPLSWPHSCFIRLAWLWWTSHTQRGRREQAVLHHKAHLALCFLLSTSASTSSDLLTGDIQWTISIKQRWVHDLFFFLANFPHSTFLAFLTLKQSLPRIKFS